MTDEQRQRFNEAHHLINIAARILRDADHVTFADEAEMICMAMRRENMKGREEYLKAKGLA